MTYTTRTKFTEQLNEVRDLLIRLAEKTTADIRAIDLGAKGDMGAAKGVIGGRKEERRLSYSIEQTCFDIMLLQQPLIGDDFRFITSSFRVVSDLSHVDGMTRDAMFLLEDVPAKKSEHLAGEFTELADLTAQMLVDSVKAFLEKDVIGASAVIARDDRVNELYAICEQKLVQLIRDETVKPKYLPELLMVAKYFERIGDSSKAIARWAIFRVTGEHNDEDDKTK